MSLEALIADFSKQAGGGRLEAGGKKDSGDLELSSVGLGLSSGDLPAELQLELSQRCGRCGSSHLWQPRRSSEWLCMACVPPAADSMIGQECGGSVRIEEAGGWRLEAGGERREVIDRRFYTTPEVRCGQCGGRVVKETTWSDGECVLQCWTCNTVRDQADQG